MLGCPASFLEETSGCIPPVPAAVEGTPAGCSAGSVGEPLGRLAGLRGPLAGGKPEKGKRHERSLIIWASGQPGPGGDDWSEAGVMSGQGEGTGGPESTLSSMDSPLTPSRKRSRLIAAAPVAEPAWISSSEASLQESHDFEHLPGGRPGRQEVQGGSLHPRASDQGRPGAHFTPWTQSHCPPAPCS